LRLCNIPTRIILGKHQRGSAFSRHRPSLTFKAGGRSLSLRFRR
jgi:hypothetical protein